MSISFSDNLVAWERFERERDALVDKLAAANAEFSDTKKVYDLGMGPKDREDRLKTAAVMRKDIQSSFDAMNAANEILAKLLDEGKKGELNEQVSLICSYIISIFCLSHFSNCKF